MSVENDRILRGHIFYAAVAFSDGTPVDFFEPIPDLGKGFGRIVSKMNGFNPVYDENGKKYSPTLNVVVKHKVRLSVVIQSNLFNQNESYDHVYIAPIATIHPTQEKTELIERLKDTNDIPQLHYIGNHTGRPAYVNVSDIKRIHKSLLIEETRFSPLCDSDLEQMDYKISTLLEIKKLMQFEEISDDAEEELSS